MKHQWTEEQSTCQELSEALGCPVKSITRGQVIVGYEQSLDEDGEPTLSPVTRKGIEIEFGKKPTDEQLARLDAIFSEFHRAGAMSVPDELTALKDRIKQVEDDMAELKR